MYVKVTLSGPDNVDQLSRRMVGDIMTLPDIDDAELVRLPAAPGEKGLIEQIGTIGISLLSAGGGEILIDYLKTTLSQMAAGPSEKTIILELDGKRAELRGNMSNEEFAATTDRILSMMQGN
jgi:hypothetical protein